MKKPVRNTLRVFILLAFIFNVYPAISVSDNGMDVSLEHLSTAYAHEGNYGYFEFWTIRTTYWVDVIIGDEMCTTEVLETIRGLQCDGNPRYPCNDPGEPTITISATGNLICPDLPQILPGL